MRAKGIFISEFQNTFKYLGNIDYIWQRVTDGMVTDAQYFAMLPEVKKVPRRGAVHNYRNHVGWKAQTDNFLVTMDAYFQMIALDYEDENMTKDTAIGLWCSMCYVAEQTKLPVVYYVALYNLRDRLMAFNGTETEYGPIDFNSSNLWIARPTVNADFENGEPGLAIGGVPVTDNWLFWQYWWEAPGSKYGCGSVHVCEDVFNGTPEEMDVWLGKVEVPVDEMLGKLARLTLDNSDRIDEIFTDIKTIKARLLKTEVKNKGLEAGQLELAENGLKYEDDIRALAHNAELYLEESRKGDELITDAIAKLEENGLGYEERMAKLEARLTADEAIFHGSLDSMLHEFLNADERINSRIDGLQGGHNHPEWMKWLGLVKE